MASDTPKMVVRSATGKLRPFNFDTVHITTSDFGIMKPIKTLNCVPGDQIDIKISEFTRLMPMPAPTFGSLMSKTRAFFVPYRVLFTDWLDFIANNVHYTSNGQINPTVPTLTLAILSYHIFYQHLSDLFTILNEDAAVYDCKVVLSGVTRKFKFTSAGRRVYDMMCCLGLPLDLQNLSTSNNPTGSSVNILPFLAVWKLYLDWVVPSRFVHVHKKVLELLSCSSVEITSKLNSKDDYSFLAAMLQPIYSYYEDDYFTSAWQNPTGVETSGAYDTNVPTMQTTPYETYGSNGVFVPSSANPDYRSNVESTYKDAPNGAMFTPVIEHASPDNIDNQKKYNQPIDYFTIRTLGALQDMVNRGKLVGSKIQDYLEVTYGFRPSSDALNLSTYLGKSQSEIMIGDVMSTSGTDHNELGQFAGRGIGSNDSHFRYEVKEHGLFLVFNEISAKAMYVDGLDAMFDQKDRLDFFQPELDNLGCEAIPLHRLQSIGTSGSVFGFAPRYAGSYKYAFDRVSGDFKVPSLNTGLDSWYLSRTFNVPSTSSWRFINNSFCLNTSDSPLQNLDRIFSDSSNDADHFYSIFRFDCRMLRPMLPISQALETYHHNELGKDKSYSVNGGLD
nr:major head protein [Microvirus sp.]